MKTIVCALLLTALLLPGLSEPVTPVEAFVRRAGIEPDAALKARIEAFIAENTLNRRIIEAMDPALLRRYAEYLEKELPIHYTELMDLPATALPGDAAPDAIRQLLVLQPQGAGLQSLLVDFERGRLYYDEAWPVYADVCRAQYAAALESETAEALLSILSEADLKSWDASQAWDAAPAGEVAPAWDAAQAGDALPGACVLALRHEAGVARYADPAMGEAFYDLLYRLLEAAVRSLYE